jgi:hypothetical protein
MKLNPASSSLNFILTLSFHIHPGLQSGLCLSDFVTKMLYGLLSIPMCAACPVYCVLPDLTF